MVLSAVALLIASIFGIVGLITVAHWSPPLAVPPTLASWFLWGIWGHWMMGRG